MAVRLWADYSKICSEHVLSISCIKIILQMTMLGWEKSGELCCTWYSLLHVESHSLWLKCHSSLLITVRDGVARGQGREQVICHGLLHVECHFIWIFNLNLNGLFSTERGKRNLDYRLRIRFVCGTLHRELIFEKYDDLNHSWTHGHEKIREIFFFFRVAALQLNQNLSWEGDLSWCRQCIAVCCSVLQCIVVWCSVLDDTHTLAPLSHVQHDSFICVTWLMSPDVFQGRHALIHMCAMTHLCVWHETFMCVIWNIHVCDMTYSYVWHDSFMSVTWLIHMCGTTHSCVWLDSFICEKLLIYMCDMTHSYVWHDLFIRVTLLIHVCDMTHQITHRVPQKKHALNHTCDMTHSCVWHDSFICVIWLTRSLIESPRKNMPSSASCSSP